jgi:hypothetical protein
MLTGVAIIPTGLAGLRDLPYGWEFVVVVILLILLFYVRVYRPGHRTGRRASRVPEQGGNHEHSALSRRRPNQP